MAKSKDILTVPPVVLASGSRYRCELLARLLPDFERDPPEIDETAGANENPKALASRLARLKAEDRAKEHRNSVVIGSDQVPALGGNILRKPETAERAFSQLRQSSGETVHFYTAVCVIGAGGSPVEEYVDITTVTFRALADDEILRYLDEEKPYDCAGSFKAEGLGIMLFKRIENNDPTAIQGLPLIWLSGALRRCGVRLGG